MGIWPDCSDVLTRSHNLDDNFTTHLRTSSPVTVLKSSNVWGETRLTSGTRWLGTAACKSTSYYFPVPKTSCSADIVFHTFYAIDCQLSWKEVWSPTNYHWSGTCHTFSWKNKLKSCWRYGIDQLEVWSLRHRRCNFPRYFSSCLFPRNTKVQQDAK